MSIKHIYWIIGLMVIALVGIISLQVYLIGKAIDINEDNFNTGVQQSLQHVVERMQEEELEAAVFRASRELNIDLRNDVAFEDEQYLRRKEKLTIRLEEEESKGNSTRSIEVKDSLQEYLKLEGRDTILITNSDESFVWIQGNDERSLVNKGVQQNPNPEILDVLQHTLSNLTMKQADIEKRIDSIRIDTLLRHALTTQGIDGTCEFMVHTGNKIYVQTSRMPSIFAKEHLVDGWKAFDFHRTLLFPNYHSGFKTYITVFFPDQSFFAMRSIWLIVLGSILFTAIILVCFGLTIKTIFRQKKLSKMKNDFINNMTHELKTPIATISLVVDSMKNPSVRSNGQRTDHYMNVIKEENQRMNRQVERVLQAARFDRGELDFSLEMLEVHEILHKSSEHIRMQVDQRHGKLEWDLHAAQTEVMADPVHLVNIFSNLLDNANKYSPEAPHIILRTYNLESHCVIEVVDHGIGISKSHQPYIFDRFYRVSQGDLHDVKGFGLGLSYVKEMVEALNGSIQVQSKEQKGSTFRVYLPIATVNERMTNA